MAHYQVTVDDEVLQQLFSRGDGLARLVEQVLNQILEAQVTEQLKARLHKRTEQRQGYRNGHREKPLTTRIGRLVLEMPRVRSGEFSPERFVRYMFDAPDLKTLRRILKLLVQEVEVLAPRRWRGLRPVFEDALERYNGATGAG